MIDTRLDVGDNGILEGHVLIDAITSASVAAGTAQGVFEEQRYELGLVYTHDLGVARVGGGGRVSYEPDYMSTFGKLHADIDFADKNTVLGFDAAFGHDDVGRIVMGLDRTSTRMDVGTLTTYLGAVTLTQILSPNAIAHLTYDVTSLKGDQANPYRLVDSLKPGPDGIPIQITEPETHPDERLRQAIAGQLRYFIEPTETTLVAGYRYYLDDWGLRAHTPDVRVIQQAGDSIDLTLRYRFHFQTAADFYRPSYPSLDGLEYYTRDAKLSRLTTHTIEFRVGTLLGALGVPGNLADARAEVIVEYIAQSSSFGNAGVAHVALTVPFEY